MNRSTPYQKKEVSNLTMENQMVKKFQEQYNIIALYSNKEGLQNEDVKQPSEISSLIINVYCKNQNKASSMLKVIETAREKTTLKNFTNNPSIKMTDEDAQVNLPFRIMPSEINLKKFATSIVTEICRNDDEFMEKIKMEINTKLPLKNRVINHYSYADEIAKCVADQLISDFKTEIKNCDLLKLQTKTTNFPSQSILSDERRAPSLIRRKKIDVPVIINPIYLG
jgi:hypothetical protein